ncbi:hypothetical protein E4191_16500 (plasmid) [Paracoccus liaowanqingii]|uniref:Uncharacterized protein n=1 Tax=Paracoccus liaowanqingii TaxID=2560053 RepID=A0A4Y5SSI9_9RHOB|nr:hypothetical protein [Paracoccus liaowanqingii]QDA35765.1 hypothetical protein E4191_16500 [Paracoccus liaowanqingii]
MMPVIRLNDATFVDLKSVATWLEAKTPSEAIDKLVREKMAALDLERDDMAASSVGEKPKFLFEETRLSYTRLLAASVKGQAVPRQNWANVLLAVISVLKSKGKGLSSESLCLELQVPSKVGVYNKDGYKYHPSLDISIQGQSAADAWKETSRIANKHRIPVEVTFQWRDNEKAVHPGQSARLKAGK